MKKLIISLTLAVAAAAPMTATAEIPITKVDKIEPTDMVFMDMATGAAEASVKQKGAPDGAVIILNGAFRSSGRPSASETAIASAVAKSRLKSLKNATVYVVNEPVTSDYIALCRLGADAICFVNGRDAVIAAGIVPASEYDDSKIPADLKQVPLRAIEFPEAQKLVGK